MYARTAHMYTSPWTALHSKALDSFRSEWFIIVLIQVSLWSVFPPWPSSFTHFLWLVSGPLQLMFSGSHWIMSFAHVWYCASLSLLIKDLLVCSGKERATHSSWKTWKTKQVYVNKQKKMWNMHKLNLFPRAHKLRVHKRQICINLTSFQECPSPWYLLHLLQEIFKDKVDTITAAWW